VVGNDLNDSIATAAVTAKEVSIMFYIVLV